MKRNIEFGENGLDWADKSTLSSYNAEMNGVITAFRDWKKDAESDAYYLFVVPKFSEGGVEGFMPRNRRFGFITQEQLIPRTVAHELGHGAFNLRHTFPEAPQGSTDNLMDYAGGTSLYKPQWDLIHNPEVTTGLFDDMEDGAAKTAVKGTPVVTIADSTMKEGKIFIYNGSGNKVKFETTDSTEAKITYRLTTLIETTKAKLNYPKTGYDTLTFKQVKEITLDSIPEGQYTLLCKLGSTEYKTNFYIRKQKFEVTKEQLKKIFKDTDDKRIEEVVKAINENSLLYAINTPERMAHFIGQIGAETGGLKKLKEDFNYTAENIFNTFLKPNLRSRSTSKTGKTFWFCDLVEGYNCTSINSCIGTNQSQADCDSAISVKLKNGKCAWNYVNFDSTYNVKSAYVSSLTLFDYVYGCRMDNGAKPTKDAGQGLYTYHG